MVVIPTKNEFARTGGVTIPTSGEFVKVPDGGGGGVTVTPLSATENGTYTAPSGTAYSPVTVDVPVGVPLYSGTLTLASRPAAPGVFATLDAPKCTHFAMYADDTPDLTTGKAFWGFAFVEKDQATFAIASNNAGTGLAYSGAGIDGAFNAQTMITGNINTVFGENRVELSTTNVGDTARLPQAGLDYKWFAW